MEEMNLNELTEEFKNLQASVNQTSAQRQAAQDELNLKSENVVAARDAVQTAETNVTGIRAALESMENNPYFNAAALQAQRDNLADAERALNEAKARLEITEKDEVSAREAFDAIEVTSHEQNERMDLILASFGFNKKINEAITNELEIDYEDKIQAEVDKRKNVEDRITQISEDEEVKNLVEAVRVSLEEYTNYWQANFASTDNSVNAREEELRNAYRTQIDELKRKMQATYNLTMSDQDITDMRTLDAKGRFTINGLNKELIDIDTRRGVLDREKSLALRKMKLAREAAADPTIYDAELQTLENELNAIDSQIQGKENERTALEARRIQIPEEKRRLNEDLVNAENGVDNTQAIADKKKEIAQLEADIAAAVKDNPDRVDLEKRIAELEKQIKNPSQVESQAYKDAVAELEAAENALANMGSMSKDDADKIADYDKQIAELQAEIEQIEQKTNTTELQEKETKMNDAEKELQEAEKELEDAKNAAGKTALKNDLEKLDYVSDDIMPDLAKKGTDQNKLFEAYREAELKLRQAMLQAQKDPSEENVKAIETAMKGYKSSYEALSAELSKGRPQNVSMKACHNYLLDRLAKEDPESLDPAYNSKEMSNRFKVLEALHPKLKNSTEYRLSVKGTVDSMTKYFDSFVTGEPYSDDFKSIKEDLEHYAGAFKSLEDDKKYKLNSGRLAEVLKGEGLPGKATGFFANLFGKKLPQPETEIDFEAGKTELPDEIKEKLEKLAEIDEQDAVKTAMDKVKEKQEAFDNAKKTYENAKLRSGAVLTQADRADISTRKKKISGLDTQKRAIQRKYSADPAEKAKLEKARDDAQDKVNNTDKYEPADVSALEQERDDLVAKRSSVPEKIGDPAQKSALQAKKASLEAEVAVLEAGGRDDAKIASIKAAITALEAEEVDIPTKLQQVEEDLSSLNNNKVETERRFSSIKAAKEKIARFIGKIIGIKDAGRISYNSDSQRVDRTMIDSYKENVMREAKDDEGR